VTNLVRARQRVSDLKDQLAEAEREDKRAYIRATKDGWSADELKKLGLENPVAGRGRPTAHKNAGHDTATPATEVDKTIEE
jgi:hypothetical protein